MNEFYAQAYLVPAQALARTGLTASRAQPAVWDFPVGQGGHAATAVVYEGMVYVLCLLPRMPEQALADIGGAYARMLRWNSRLAGAARFVLSNPDGLCLEAVTLLVDQDHDVDSVIEAVRGVQQGWSLFGSLQEPGANDKEESADVCAPTAPAALVELEAWAGRAGWACRRRPWPLPSESRPSIPSPSATRCG